MIRRRFLSLLGLAPALAIPKLVVSKEEGIDIWIQHGFYGCVQCGEMLHIEQLKLKIHERPTHAIAYCSRPSCRNYEQKLKIPLEYMRCERLDG